MLAFSNRDRFPRPQIVSENFGEQLPASAHFRRKALAHDVTQSVRQPDSKLLLLSQGEKAEDTVDRLAGVHRVERAQHQVPGFRGHQCNLDGGAIAHFTDQDDLGSLAERRAQSVGIIIKVVTQFALVESRFLRRVHEFDRILQGDDVHRLLLVYLIEQRRQGGRLTASGRPGEKDQPRFLLGNFREDAGQAQTRNARNIPFEFAQHDRKISLLPKNIDAETDLFAERITAIARSAGEIIVNKPPISLHQGQRDLLRLIRGKGFDGRIDKDRL